MKPNEIINKHNKFNAFFKEVLLLSGLSSLNAHAGDAKQLLQNLNHLYPQTQFDDVKNTPVSGIYQVSMGQNIAYVEKDGRYFLFGTLYDMQAQKDLTAQGKTKIQQNQFASLPFQNAITIKKGNGGKGKREFALFTDPDCPFCQRLEETLAGMSDYTVHVFLYPILSLHPDAGEISEKIWCSKNQEKAWNDYMLLGKIPASQKCTSPIQDNIQLATRLDVRGTPTLLHIDGRKTSGAMPRMNLERWLNGEEL